MRGVCFKKIYRLYCLVIGFFLFALILQGTLARYSFLVNVQVDMDGVGNTGLIHNINYYLNGGTQAPNAPTTINENQTLTLPTPTKTDFTFDGWYDNASFTGSAITTLSNVTTDVYLYAKWSADPTVFVFIVSGDSNGLVVLDNDITSTNPIRVTDLVGNDYNGVNTSNKVINRIDVSFTYTSSTGSSQSINAVLSYNNTTAGTQQVTFRGKQTNQTVTVSFTGLSIGVDDTFTVSIASNNISNGNINISAFNLSVYFAEVNPNMVNSPLEMNAGNLMMSEPQDLMISQEEEENQLVEDLMASDLEEGTIIEENSTSGEITIEEEEVPSQEDTPNEIQEETSTEEEKNNEVEENIPEEQETTEKEETALEENDTTGAEETTLEENNTEVTEEMTIDEDDTTEMEETTIDEDDTTEMEETTIDEDDTTETEVTTIEENDMTETEETTLKENNTAVAEETTTEENETIETKETKEESIEEPKEEKKEESPIKTNSLEETS